MLAIASPVLAIPAMYGWAYLLAILLGIAVVMFVVEMLRASVLPVVPLFLLAAGPLTYLLVSVGLVIAGRDAGQELFLAYSLSGVGMVWLGWYQWREPAADAPRRRRSVASA